MHMQNLSRVGVLDAPALMPRFIIAVSARLHKYKGFQHANSADPDKNATYCNILLVNTVPIEWQPS